jgi:hypothetical protein
VALSSDPAATPATLSLTRLADSWVVCSTAFFVAVAPVARLAETPALAVTRPEEAPQEPVLAAAAARPGPGSAERRHAEARRVAAVAYRRPQTRMAASEDSAVNAAAPAASATCQFSPDS